MSFTKEYQNQWRTCWIISYHQLLQTHSLPQDIQIIQSIQLLRAISSPSSSKDTNWNEPKKYKTPVGICQSIGWELQQSAYLEDCETKSRTVKKTYFQKVILHYHLMYIPLYYHLMHALYSTVKILTPLSMPFPSSFFFSLSFKDKAHYRQVFFPPLKFCHVLSVTLQ